MKKILNTITHTFVEGAMLLFIALPVASLVVASSPAVTFAEDPPAAPAAPTAPAPGGTAPAAAPATVDCGSGFLGIRPWYYGLTDPSADCAIISPTSSDADAL